MRAGGRVATVLCVGVGAFALPAAALAHVERPAGPCKIRKEDHQAIYAVPWGRIKHDPKFPMPVLGDLRVAPPPTGAPETE